MIKNTNIVFEIKSTYIWKKYYEKNILKKEAAEKLYQYHLIMDNNFEILLSLLEKNEFL
jgi:Na+/phosphate symporter